MQYVLWCILTLLIIVIAAFVTIIWHRWILYIRYSQRKLLIELRGFGIKRKIVYRDFSKKTDTKTAVSASKAKPKKKKNGKTFGERLSERRMADKKRIYDSEKGGYQPGGLKAVFHEYLDIYKEIKSVFHELFDDLRYRIDVSSLRIGIDYGTGDPAHTGMLYGTIWGMVGVLYPLFSKYIKMVYPDLKLSPDFYGKRFNLEIESIIKVKPVHIINAVIKQLWRQGITYLNNHFTKGSVKNG